MREEIQKELDLMVTRDGYGFYKLIAVKDLPHKDDHYLKCVLVERESGFVTWLYNTSTKGFGSGNYFDYFAYGNDKEVCKLKAEENFASRYQD